MADTQPFNSSPYGVFDPSQFSNPYSRYSGALPWPSQYAGTPTDAYGRPIQSFLDAQQAAVAQPAPAPTPPPGVTLNSAPSPLDQQRAWALARAASPIGDYSGAGTTFGANNQRMQSALIQQQINAGAILGQGQGQQQTAAAAPQPAAPAAPAAPAPPAAPAFDSYGAALSALANPGKVTTPGATIAPSATPYQPGSGVLQQFLANWNPAASGPGAGFQQGFAKALGRK